MMIYHNQEIAASSIEYTTFTLTTTSSSDDCAWCGTGDGLCHEHMAALVEQSTSLVASGVYLADRARREVSQ